MSGFRALNGTPVFELTSTKAGAWHGRDCACPGAFEELERYHLASAGIRVLRHPSTAVLACTWDGLELPYRGAPYAVTQARSARLFRALRTPLTPAQVAQIQASHRDG